MARLGACVEATFLVGDHRTSMPLLLVTSNLPIPDEVLDRLAVSASRALDVPSSRIMAMALRGCARMGGNSTPVALVELRSSKVIPLEERRLLVRAFIDEIRRSAEVAEERIYVRTGSEDPEDLWRSVDGRAVFAGEGTRPAGSNGESIA